MQKNTDSIKIIFDFKEEKDLITWNAVNDNVMGGLSQGGATLTEDSCLRFVGSISLENNGGFASISTFTRDYVFDGYKGIRIRVKGDGRLYQFRLRTQNGEEEIAFKREFQTVPGTWIEIDLPFKSFLPSYRGKILENIKPVNASEIGKIGFLITDKTEGPFSLMVSDIRAYR